MHRRRESIFFFFYLNGHTAQRSPEPLSFKKGSQRPPQSVIRWESGGLLGVQSENGQTVRQRSEDPLRGW